MYTQLGIPVADPNRRSAQRRSYRRASPNAAPALEAAYPSTPVRDPMGQSHRTGRRLSCDHQTRWLPEWSAARVSRTGADVATFVGQV
jgi:hypothetical protein